MKCMILAGDDKLGRLLLSEICDESVVKVFDRSFSFKRVFHLVKNGRMSPVLFLKIFIAEVLRKDTPAVPALEIHSNSDLLRLIEEHQVDVVFMFRVGLVISNKVINSRARVVNFHCARLPEYGGLGAINRALKNADYQQEATMYYITGKIDDGEIIAVAPYTLDPTRPYRENEDIAYLAGIQLIKDQLKVWNS